MSSLAKAAIISAAVFVVIVAASLFFLSRSKNGAPVSSEKSGEDVAVAPAKPEEPPRKSTAITTPISREAVKVSIDVLEKGRKRKLTGSRAMVLHATDGDRAGEKAWESGKDSSGSFSLELEPGAYTVRVQCPRYTGQKRDITVIKDTPLSLAFELERGNSICGRVLAVGGRPIGGARVLALRELAAPGASLEEQLIGMIKIQENTGTFAAEAISAEDGAYCLDGLEVFAYTVRATASGFTPAELPDVPAPRAEADIVLQKGGVVSGVVRDTNGRAVSNAAVKAYRELESQNVFSIIMSKARPPMDTASSNPSGQFELKTLGPGLYNFLVEAKGYQRGEQLKVRVTPGQTNNLAFTIKPGLTLKGIVSGPNGEPVSGAKVRASLTGAGAAARKDQVSISFDEDKIVTNDQGEFSTDTLDEGTYMVLCWHQDYQTLRKNDVHVGPSTDPLQLKLTNGGRIRGVITDGSTGKPVAGARLSASDVADIHKDAVSQEDGAFVLAGLTTSGRSVTVNVTADGFARLRKDVKAEENREVEENFELQPTGIVTGRVVNSAGDGIPGARVQAKRAAESGSVEQTLTNDVTDREGKYELRGIDAGENNWIRVKKSEFLDGSSEAFAIEPSQSLELPPIVLQLGGSLAGKVVGPDGNPITDCMVIVTHEGETEVQQSSNPSSTTSTRGEFLIQGLQSGTVELLVKATHFLETRVPNVEVKEGSVHRDIVIKIEQGSSVSGTVVDGKGKPVANADIMAKDYSQGVKELRTSSSGDGRFTVEGIVSSDVVELEVAHDSYAGYSDPKVRVGSSDLKVVLKEHGSLHGIVTTSDGKPVESFAIQASNPATKDPRKQPKPQNFTAADGSFEYHGVPGGIYSVSIRAPQYSAATIADVKVEEGESVDLGTVVLQVGGRVNGQVIDSVSKRPIEGARVQITQGSSRFASRTDASTASGGPAASPIQTTGADGSFNFVGLKGGALSLRISHDGFVTRKVDDVNPDVAEKSQDLVVELDQGGEITGTVFDSEGKPRAGMSVYLIGPEATSNQTQQTDSGGKFRFQGVHSGSFTVKAHKFGQGGGGAEQAEATVELAPGTVQQVDLQLE